MKRNTAVSISCLLVMAALAQIGVALGSTPAAPQESTVTTLPDGSIVIRNKAPEPTSQPDRSNVSQGQAMEQTVTSLPDGSIVMTGQIKYSKALDGYVVEDLNLPGVHGQYLIANPDDKVLAALAKQGSVVTVQGFLNEGALTLMVQAINGKAYR